jgi:hypothetical protein
MVPEELIFERVPGTSSASAGPAIARAKRDARIMNFTASLQE